MSGVTLAQCLADERGVLHALIDGAACADVAALLPQPGDGNESCCLYAGDIVPALAAVAPYLVRFGRGTDYAARLQAAFEGTSLGVLATLPASLGFREARCHFRHCLRARLPGHGVVAFRYYDPRVLRAFLGVCSRDERRALFGPVESFLTHGDAGWTRTARIYRSSS